jgi:hypothetical protein
VIHIDQQEKIKHASMWSRINGVGVTIGDRRAKGANVFNNKTIQLVLIISIGYRCPHISDFCASNNLRMMPSIEWHSHAEIQTIRWNLTLGDKEDIYIYIYIYFLPTTHYLNSLKIQFCRIDMQVLRMEELRLSIIKVKNKSILLN